MIALAKRQQRARIPRRRRPVVFFPLRRLSSAVTLRFRALYSSSSRHFSFVVSKFPLCALYTRLYTAPVPFFVVVVVVVVLLSSSSSLLFIYTVYAHDFATTTTTTTRRFRHELPCPNSSRYDDDSSEIGQVAPSPSRPSADKSNLSHAFLASFPPRAL